MEEITLNEFILLVQAELEEEFIYGVSDEEIEKYFYDGYSVEQTVEELSKSELDLN